MIKNSGTNVWCDFRDDSCNHCGYPSCGQKRIVLDLLENLETIRVSFHCICYDCPSCFARNNIANSWFLIILLAHPLPLKTRLMRPCSQKPGSFKVNLVQWTVPQCRYRVIVTNNENWTYFSGPAWRVFAQHYELIPGEKLILWFNECDNDVLFNKSDPDD
jgi:hypothetical protein